MYLKIMLLVALLPGIPVSAMERTKEMSSVTEMSQSDVVRILLTDSQSSNTIHEVAIPIRYAKLIGAISDLLEDFELREAGLPLLNVTVSQWRLIESQLEKLYSIVHDDPHVTHSREAIIEEYELLDAQGLIEVIHALDYADIPLLLELACDVVKQSDLERFSVEQMSSLPREMDKRILLHKILCLGGPMFAKEVTHIKHESIVSSVCVTKDGKIVSGYRDGTVRVWDMKGNELAVCTGHEFELGPVCVTSDGTIVSGFEDGMVRVWDMQGNQLAECRGHEAPVQSVCVTKDGKIVSGSWDKTVRVWDLQGNQLAVCRGHDGEVGPVCVTNDGKIISCSADNTLRVWDMSGKEYAVCRGHESLVWSVCVTNDDKIVSGSFDNTVRIWDMQGKELAVCRGHTRSINSVCVTSDRKIVSGSDDCSVRVWDMKGDELAVCMGHEYQVNAVCVTSDDKIVSASLDKTVRVWDMQGREIAVCRGHADRVNSICVMSDGKIISGAADKTVRVWNISWLASYNRMNGHQAQKLWELLQKISPQAEIDKNQFWKEIEEILGEGAQVTRAIGNNNNE